MPSGTQRGSQLDAKIRNEKSRDLRSKFRSLTETIRNDGEDLADHTKDLLTDRVRELDSLSKQVERPSEQADDSEAFYTLTQRGAEMAKRMAAGKGRTANDFIRHLKVLFGESLDAQRDGALHPKAFNWIGLSRSVKKYFRHAPGASCMLGPMDAVMKVKKPVQRLQRKAVGKAIAPQVLQAEDAQAQEKRETERNMETMWSVLKSHSDGIEFLELTMNCESFSQFTENIFTLAFLVHNKRARLEESENNNSRGMLVFPHNERAAIKEGRPTVQGKERLQFVMAYTMDDWKSWKRYVRKEDCLMPHRAEHDYEAELAAERVTQASEEENEGTDDQADEDRAGPSQPANPRSTPKKNSRKSAVSDESEEDSEEDRPARQSRPKGKRIRKAAAG